MPGLSSTLPTLLALLTLRAMPVLSVRPDCLPTMPGPSTIAGLPRSEDISRAHQQLYIVRVPPVPLFAEASEKPFSISVNRIDRGLIHDLAMAQRDVKAKKSFPVARSGASTPSRRQ